MRGAAPASSTGPPSCSSSGRGTATSPLSPVKGWRSTRQKTPAATARSTTSATMIRAVAAAVARSVSAGSISSPVVLGQQLTHRLGGASTAAASARQLRSCARAAAAASSSQTTTAAAADVAASPPASSSPPTPSFRAAIDFRALKASLPAAVANVEARRAVGADPVLVARLYDEWRALQDSLEKVRAERNDNAKAVKVKRESFFFLGGGGRKSRREGAAASPLVDYPRRLSMRAAFLSLRMRFFELFFFCGRGFLFLLSFPPL